MTTRRALSCCSSSSRRTRTRRRAWSPWYQLFEINIRSLLADFSSGADPAADINVLIFRETSTASAAMSSSRRSDDGRSLQVLKTVGSRRRQIDTGRRTRSISGSSRAACATHICTSRARSFRSITRSPARRSRRSRSTPMRWRLPRFRRRKHPLRGLPNSRSRQHVQDQRHGSGGAEQPRKSVSSHFGRAGGAGMWRQALVYRAAVAAWLLAWAHPAGAAENFTVKTLVPTFGGSTSLGANVSTILALRLWTTLRPQTDPNPDQSQFRRRADRMVAARHRPIAAAGHSVRSRDPQPHRPVGHGRRIRTWRRRQRKSSRTCWPSRLSRRDRPGSSRCRISGSSLGCPMPLTSSRP